MASPIRDRIVVAWRADPTRLGVLPSPFGPFLPPPPAQLCGEGKGAVEEEAGLYIRHTGMDTRVRCCVDVFQGSEYVILFSQNKKEMQS